MKRDANSWLDIGICFDGEELDGGGLTLGALPTMKQITSNAI